MYSLQQNKVIENKITFLPSCIWEEPRVEGESDVAWLGSCVLERCPEVGVISAPQHPQSSEYNHHQRQYLSGCEGILHSSYPLDVIAVDGRQETYKSNNHNYKL